MRKFLVPSMIVLLLFVFVRPPAAPAQDVQETCSDADDPHACEHLELSQRFHDALRRIAEMESCSICTDDPPECFSDLDGIACRETEIGCLCFEIPTPLGQTPPPQGTTGNDGRDPLE